MASNALQQRLARRFVHLLSGSTDGKPPWLSAVADGEEGGFYLPGDAPWVVHRDFATLVGGVRALLLQALHPGALGGVAQHSRYEEDPLGRLSGTIRWLTVTTFGSMTAIRNEAGRVNKMHDRVAGEYEKNSGEKTPYQAADKDLLLWVHIAFMDSFLRAHQNYSTNPIPGGADAYVAQWSKSVGPLGLDKVPMSETELIEALDHYRPQLRVDEKARSVISWIRNAPLPRAAKPAYRLLFHSALATLPKDFRQMIGIRSYPLWILRPITAFLLVLGRKAIGPDSPIEDAAKARLQRVGLI